MRQRGSRTALSLLICVLASRIAAVSVAGDLEPPPGPIAPTDRVRLNAQQITLPFTIDAPGSYVLTSDLVGSQGGHGLVIATGGVTLDLNGFALRGVKGALDAIHIDGEHADIEITNGVITGWTGDGVEASLAIGGVISDLRISGCGGNGIEIGTWEVDGPEMSDGGVVRDCTVSRCGGDGIRISREGLITGCRALDNLGAGIRAIGTCTIRESAGLRNAHHGIISDNGLVSSCTAEENGTGGINGARVEHSYAIANTADGIVGDAVFDCTAYGNTGPGIRAGSVIDSTSSNNAGGGVWLVAAFTTNAGGQIVRGCAVVGNGLQSIDGPAAISVEFGECIIENNSVRRNYHGGISCGDDSIVRGNQVFENRGDGVRAGAHCDIRNNLVSENQGVGIEATTSVIDSNTIFGNEVGIVAANAHLVARNVLATNDEDYQFSGNCNLDLLIGQLPFEALWPCKATLTRDAVVSVPSASGAAILIASDRVEIDLGGQTISEAFPLTTGVLVSGDRHSVTLRNGEVRGFANGVNFGSSTDSRIEGIRAVNNSSIGITAGYRAVISDCIAAMNGDDGIQAYIESTVLNCQTFENDGAGLFIAKRCIVREHVSRRNGVGISANDGNSIESCIAGENTTGYLITGTGNRIVRNSSTQDGDGFVITSSGNTYGPIVSVGLGEILSNNPWANFED